MAAKQPRPDELEFRAEVLRQLGVLSAYVERERTILVEQIRDLRRQLEASKTERDSLTTS